MNEINLKNASSAYSEYAGALATYRRYLKRSGEDYHMTKEYGIRQQELFDRFVAVSDDALKDVLSSAQKRCRSRCITSADIVETLVKIKDKIGISNTAMEGVSVNVDNNAYHFPRAYKGIPESTQFTAVYRNGSWRVTAIYRKPVKAPTKAIQITHTEESRRAICERFSAMSVLDLL